MHMQYALQCLFLSFRKVLLLVKKMRTQKCALKIYDVVIVIIYNLIPFL